MSDIYVDIHGVSHHFSDVEYQERNIGAGVRWEEQSDGKRLMTVIGGYLNSRNRPSLYIAKGVKWPVSKHADVGVIAGFVSGYRAHPIPAVLPVVSFGSDSVRINMMAVPPIEGVTPATISISAQFRVSQ